MNLTGHYSDQQIEEFRKREIVICLVDGEFTVKRIKKEKNELYLMQKIKIKPIELKEINKLVVWGVVSCVIKKIIVTYWNQLKIHIK